MSKCSEIQKWNASIKFRGENHFLGVFETEEDAGLAYNQKAIEFHGSDAKVNFPHLSPEERTEKLRIIHLEKKITKRELLSNVHQGRKYDYPKTSIYTGVCYLSTGKKINRWLAQISHLTKCYYLGCFATQEEAALAYDEKALELFGKEAKLNFPDLSLEEMIQKRRMLTLEQRKAGRSDSSTFSAYLGVARVPPEKKRAKPWTASISYKGKAYYLGLFVTEEEAALTYDEKSIEFYGSGRKRNFPDLSLDEIKEKRIELKKITEKNLPERKSVSSSSPQSEKVKHTKKFKGNVNYYATLL